MCGNPKKGALKQITHLKPDFLSPVNCNLYNL
jgi:hypothetical protein